jgi:hypothetical protein
MSLSSRVGSRFIRTHEGRKKICLEDQACVSRSERSLAPFPQSLGVSHSIAVGVEIADGRFSSGRDQLPDDDTHLFECPILHRKNHATRLNRREWKQLVRVGVRRCQVATAVDRVANAVGGRELRAVIAIASMGDVANASTTGARRMIDPLPALEGSVRPHHGSPVCSIRSSAERVVLPMSKQRPVELICPSRYHRT